GRGGWWRGEGRRRGELERARTLGGVGTVERGMLPAAQQCRRLERGRALAGLHPTHGSGSRLPDPEERLGAPTRVASEGRAGAGPPPGVLLGLRPLEDPGEKVPGGGTRRLSAQGLRRTLAVADDRCGAADAAGSGDPAALRRATGRAPDDPVATAGHAPAPEPPDARVVVKKPARFGAAASTRGPRFCCKLRNLG